MKGKKGQLVMVGLMISVLVIIAAIVFIEPLKEQITSARTAIDCSANDLTTGESMTCIVIDWTLPGFIGTAIAVAIGYITMRRLGRSEA